MMKPVQIMDAIPLSIDLDLLLSALRLKPDSELAARLVELCSAAQAIAVPKALYREVFIQDATENSLTMDGVRFKSCLLSTNLPPAKSRYAFIATCGAEIEVWARTFSDLLENFWADTLMELAMGAAVQTLETHLKPLCDAHALSCMNPGSLPDWPLTEQRPLFRLLGEEPGRLGITLTESCLITPLKSVSGIYFNAQEQFCNCQLCPREACPGRRVPFVNS